MVYLAAFMLAVMQCSARAASLSICVRQPTETFGDAEYNGDDARGLAPELSTRVLRDGTAVAAVAINGKTRRDVQAQAARRGCTYVVELWRQPNRERSDFSGPYGTQGPGKHTFIVGDQDVVLFALRAKGTGKVILSGVAPPTTFYRNNPRPFYPYPLFATNIVAKLNKPR